MGAFTIGVEEEYQIVDATTLALRPRAERILPIARRTVGGEVQPELVESQIEIGTPVCETLDDVRTELVRLRAAVVAAAGETGSHIAALGTHPFTDWIGQTITPGARYQRLEDDYQQLAREQLICGCHVHVCVPDPELRIRVLDRVRLWLHVVLAVTANSPFWLGADTGYASWRCSVFGRFPMTGVPPELGTVAAYDALVRDLQAVGAIDDGSFLYWDARPSTKFDTVEFRVADVCQRVDEAVLVAAVCRSLVRTAVAADDAGEPPSAAIRPEVLRAARWQASRYGLDGELVDVSRGEIRARPAHQVVGAFLDHLRPDLEAHGEWDEVQDLVARVRTDGNGARRQRAVLAATDDGDLRAVVAAAIDETVRDVAPSGAAP